MAPDRVYPDAGSVPTAPAPPGAYYNVKDQQMPPPATYQSQRRRGRGPCCCCAIWLCSVITTLIFLIGLAVLIFWLVVRPKAPRIDVQSVTISGLNGSTPINTDIAYEILATNPNKRMGFYFSDINVKVEANNQIVGQGTYPDFYQGHKNSTEIKGEIISKNVNLSSGTVTLLEQDSTNAPFYAEVGLKVKVKVGGVKSRKIKVKVKCDIYVNLMAQSDQLKSSHCKVHW